MLRRTRDKNGNLLFYLDKKQNTQVLEAIGCLRYESEKKRKTFSRSLSCRENKSPLIQAWACQGALDGKFPAHVIQAAKETGIKPSGFDFHHELPLSCGGTNDEKNIYLIDRRLHEWLHRYVWDKVYQALKYYPDTIPNGKRVFVKIPAMPKIVTWRDRFLFLTLRDRQKWQFLQADKERRPDKKNVFETQILFYFIVHQLLSQPSLLYELKSKGFL